MLRRRLAFSLLLLMGALAHACSPRGRGEDSPRATLAPPASSQAVAASSRSDPSSVRGDPHGWRQEVWWVYAGEREERLAIDYRVGEDLWGEFRMPSPLERPWTWPRPPEALLRAGCREQGCTRQIQGPRGGGAGAAEGSLVFDDEDELLPALVWTRASALQTLQILSPSAELAAYEGGVRIVDTLEGHATLMAWIRPQLCARRHE